MLGGGAAAVHIARDSSNCLLDSPPAILSLRVVEWRPLSPRPAFRIPAHGAPRKGHRVIRSGANVIAEFCVQERCKGDDGLSLLEAAKDRADHTIILVVRGTISDESDRILPVAETKQLGIPRAALFGGASHAGIARKSVAV